jgi:RNA polymerase sigma factor (sigma-70 family)
LLFEPFFCFNCGVLAKDNGGSLSTIGLTGVGQNGAAAFVTTQWSLVVSAQGDSPAAREALENLCRTYWRPVYSFVRRQGIGREEAQDLTQGFFAHLLRRRALDTVRKEKGRLRSFLLTSLKHFLANERRDAMRIKRGSGQPSLSLEELCAIELADLALADTRSADQIYERRWALTLMEQVVQRLQEEYRATGSIGLFDCLIQLLLSEPEPLPQAEIATRLGMTENAVRQAFHRFRQRYQNLLRDEISHTVALASDIEDELRHFITVLRG